MIIKEVIMKHTAYNSEYTVPLRLHPNCPSGNFAYSQNVKNN